LSSRIHPLVCLIAGSIIVARSVVVAMEPDDAGSTLPIKEKLSLKKSSKSVQITDLEGRLQTPLSQPDHTATILFFVLPDCPISNAYAPEIKRISSEYHQRKIVSFLVYVDPDMTIDAARKHAKDYGYECPVICDPSLTLVQETGVTIAPEVAVLDPSGKRLYRGRIDNLYAALGKRRQQATEHDLRNTLDAILDGKPIPNETTRSIGCFILKPEPKKSVP
jgi:Redoxin